MTHKKENNGIKIFTNGGIRFVNESTFQVKSQSQDDMWYTVKWEKTHWICDCKYYTRTKKKCKHIYSVHYYQIIEDIKDGSTENAKSKLCPICHSSKQVIKRGKRYNKNGVKQLYYCKKCNRSFCEQTPFYKMKKKANLVATALDLYYRGLSLRQITEHLQSIYKTYVCHGTIYFWLKKYVSIIDSYLSKDQIEQSERWNADETIVKVKGKHLRIWALLDEKTRFLIATHVSQKRDSDEAKKLIKLGLSKCKNKPLEMITDGLDSYSVAIREEITGPLIHLQGPLSQGYNNKIERFNRTLKSRTTPMDTFYNIDTASDFLKGYHIYYNYIRKHKTLNNVSPAQKMNLTQKNQSWMSLILEAYEENHSK